MDLAFNKAKHALAKATLLAHPNYSLLIQLVTDASKQASGAVLQQLVDGEPQPLAFFSRKTSETESRYFPYDLELLGVFAALTHFRYFLKGRRFQILTDQKPLTSAFFKAKDPLSAVAQAFIDAWILRFGIPQFVTSDRGVQFKSHLWTDIMKQLGIETNFTTAYHPEANGMVERFHRTLKASIRCRLTDNRWTKALPWVMLGLRNTPKDDLGTSAAEIMFGTTLAVPGLCWSSQQEPTPQEELRNAVSNAKQFLLTPRNVQKCKAQTFIPNTLRAAEYAFVRDDARARSSLHSPYRGPYKIIEKNFKRNTFTLVLPSGQDTVAISRLKPAFQSNVN